MVRTNSYDRVMAVLLGKRESGDRIPCMNSVSVGTVEFMKACDSFWPSAHKDPMKMAKLGSAAHRMCGLDNISIPFCMTVEAEALGAVIDFHEDMIKWPSIRSFTMKDAEDLKLPEDASKAGRVPIIVEAIKRLKNEFKRKVPVNVYMTPPFTSISSYLVDSMTFLKWLRTSPEKVNQFCRRSLDLFIEIACLYESAGADIVTFHEMGASTDNISPKDFGDFVAPYLEEIILNLKIPTILNVCGSALPIIDRMVACGASAIAIDERTPIKEARKVVDGIRPGYPIIGNIPAYGVINSGAVDKIRDFVRRALEDGVNIVAPGCDFWLETPTQHIKAFVDAATEFGSNP